jgi:predicted metal-dependent enzyme (double-stranded beta helix superfamily)
LDSPYTIRNFISDAESTARRSKNESDLLRHMKPLLERLVSRVDSVPIGAFKPRKDRFAMNLIHLPKDKAFSIIGGVWVPGQTTPIHDHLTWALIGVYSGEEREALFRRTDDNSDKKRAKLQRVSEKTNGKGHVTVLGEAGIHRVDNPFRNPAYSIHVYGRDIGPAERHSYDPVTGEISRFVSGYCNVLRDEDFI